MQRNIPLADSHAAFRLRRLAAPASDSIQAKARELKKVSRLNCFHTCRVKFYFRYVLELSKPATVALFLGKAVHAALQRWSTARWRGEPHDAESLRPVFLEY
ncbi:hypothetical protein BH09VER1_BH09VER1_47300 [soil metagenome]